MFVYYLSCILQYTFQFFYLGVLKKSAPSRIVIVASELYHFASLSLNNLNPVGGFPAYLYYVSKYANIVFAQELARRLEGTGKQHFPIL